MHVVRLKLKITQYDDYEIGRRFFAISRIHNTLVKHAKYLLRKLKHHEEYQAYLTEYIELLKKTKCSRADTARKKELASCMTKIRIELGLSEMGLQAYITKCAKRYRKLVSSQQVQKEATRVYRGVEKVLFGNAKDIHFKKNSDLYTIGGKSNTNGVKFDKSTLSIEWLKLNINCKWPDDRATKDYVVEALEGDISYCEIERKMFPNGWHYFVLVYVKGDAPKKLLSVGTNITGLDPGTSTIAAVSDDMVTLKELAPRCKQYNKQIQDLLRHMDISRRISNPNKYNPDGTINKANKDKWVFSKTYMRNLRKLKTLYRQKAAYIKQSHEETIRDLLKDSIYFYIEGMSYKGLQRRTNKPTERSDKLSEIKQKDGTTKLVHKCKKKKRFGKSLNDRAPARFISLLKTKVKLYGGDVKEINTQLFKASQYNHATDEYEKHDLKERSKYIDGRFVQRDLYSAFLIRNTDDTLTKPDKEKCIYEFENFVKLQNNLISQMKENNISMKQCFGF